MNTNIIVLQCMKKKYETKLYLMIRVDPLTYNSIVIVEIVKT